MSPFDFIQEITKNKEDTPYVESLSNLPRFKITNIVDNLGEVIFYGSLVIRRESIKSLPSNLTVLGDLSLIECPYLSELPNNLNVSKDLYIQGCSSKIKIGKYTQVKGLAEIRSDYIYTLDDTCDIRLGINTNAKYIPNSFRFINE